MRGARDGATPKATPVKKKPEAAPEPIVKVASSYGENRARMSAMKAVAGDFKTWRPASQVVRVVEAVPTQFIDYDIATGIGGHPLGRVTLAHGPSAHGKTQFGIGIGASFLRAGHFFGLLDLERTTPLPWVETMLGELMTHPGFVALQCDNTYEQAVPAVRQFCTNIAEARAQKKLPEDCTGVLLVDSIRKLQPKNLLATLAKEMGDAPKKKGRFGAKPKGIDGAGGRAGQMKAALNSAWMDELVPLLSDTRCTIVIIARETEDPDADFYENEVKVGGGSALVYESSLRLRVTQRYIFTESDGDKRQVGEVHQVGIHKSKVAGKLRPVVTAVFHTSNGLDAPSGFWRERDVLATGLELGTVEQRGAYYFHEGKRIGQGEAGVLRRLAEEPELTQAIDVATRAAARPST